MAGLKPNSSVRRFSSGFSPVHDTISEDHVLQAFEFSYEMVRDVQFAPPSARLRSLSMYETGQRPTCPLFSKLNDQTGEGDSTDAISSFESLPKPYRRSNRHLSRLNTQLLLAVKSCDTVEVQRLLDAGASPNSTCHTEYITACHIAALHNNDILSILLSYGAERTRGDRLGCTPLHFAAWSGHLKHVAALLNFPEELQKKLDNGEVTLETEEEIKKLSDTIDFKDKVDVRCVLGNLNMIVPKLWQDNIDHSCKEIDIPFVQPGWTPLHAAASTAHHLCCRVLLAAGADASIKDFVGRTPFDVAGSGCVYGQQQQSTMINFGFTEVIKMLLPQPCKRESFKKSILLDTPLHTAVELENLEVLKLLLQAGTSPSSLNRAGLTPLHLCVKKRLKKHLLAFIYVNNSDDEVRSPGLIDEKDKDGYTVLHYAVLKNWIAGVCVALEAQANIILAANDGETPLHTAAALGNLDILKEILVLAKNTKMIDIFNQKGETPLFKAILHGNADCVKLILKEGASIEITLPRQYNVFHVAANLGYSDILKVLLDHDYTFTRENINAVIVGDQKGYGPIHFAVVNNHVNCVELLLSKHDLVSLRSSYRGARRDESTPLHIAARKNYLDIAKIIVKFDHLSIHNVDAMGCTPLHTAGYWASRDVIRFLIRKGANLAARTLGPQKYQRTAIDVIMNNLSKPTEFMESILDMYINTFKDKDNKLCLEDPDTEVQVDYSVLVPKSVPIPQHSNEMFTANERHEKTPDIKLTVIEALLKTGNRLGQRRLLVHPLIESFLCLKWKALLPFFYAMLFLHGLFVLTLTMFVMSEYTFRDSNTTSKNFEFSNTTKLQPTKPLDTNILLYVLYTTIAVILVQEFINVSASFKLHFLRLETWVKLSSILLAIILPNVISTYPSPPTDAIDWPRHIATMAILLCWLDMTFLLSRFPYWGFYVLIFGKVSTNVIKILLTFAFLVIGFALSFMVQFHHQSPFETFWSALVKTMVMMTSEFDYDDLVDAKEKSKDILQSLVVIRLLFLTFLILAAIVLMNLMVGVAVNDLHNLEVLGNIMRLEKQVEFLASFETLALKKVFLKILPAQWQYNLEYYSELTNIILRPCEPAWSYYKAIPAHVRGAIFEKALAQKKNHDHQFGYEVLRKQLSDIHDTLKKVECPKKSSNEQLATHAHIPRSPPPKRLTDTDIMVVKMKRQMDDLNTKVDMMMQLVINLSLRE